MKLLEPGMLWIAAPLIILLGIILKKKFVQTDDRYADEKQTERKRKAARYGFMFTRTIIILLLVAALAEPVARTERFVDTDPEMTVLVDTSQSMELYDTIQAETMIEALKEELPVNTEYIGANQSSLLGEEILGQLGPEKNLLVVSDGHVTDGASLQSVVRFAAGLNASINFVELPTINEDAAVRIIGPQKGIAEMSNTYAIRISKTHDEPVPLTITVDGEIIYQDTYAQNTYVLERAFAKGQHTIEASIQVEDHFADNNYYARTIDVQDQPPILMITRKNSGLGTITDALYDVTRTDRFPESLEGYAAIILNDLPVNVINADKLARFIGEGNGVLAVGGERSYNNGGYANSLLETLLPVRVGTGRTSSGGANIAIAIDMSGSTGESIVYQKNEDGTLTQVGVSEQVQNLEKALAASVISDLNPSNNVGVLGYTYPQEKSKSACTGACVVHPMGALGQDKELIIDKISRVDINGNTAIWAGIEGAMKMLQGTGGSRNIILISDGVTGSTDRQQSITAVRTFRQLGGTLYVVQVGDDTAGAQLLQELAANGGGIYFAASSANNLAILFGEPVDISQGDAFDLVVLNQNHFITQGLELNAVMYAYNEVFPKPGARMLIANSGGNPVLTTWNYGVGRVASLTAYDGNDLGALLEEGNSEVLTRSVNWAIGDPQRLQDVRLTVPDTTIGEAHVANLTSNDPPSSEEVTFEREAAMNRAELPTRPIGIHEILGQRYAVNYLEELARVGLKEDIDELLQTGGGLVFTPDETSLIIEHVKTQQQLKKTEDQPIGWMFVAAAMLVYLLEVITRRILARKKLKITFS